MYRVSPFTYLIAAMLSTAVMDTQVRCAENEYLRFNPPSGQTCAQYMEPYISLAGGYLVDPAASANCSYCQIGETNTFLEALFINPKDSWRNFGLIWVYVAFNVAAALFFYWFGRVPKGKRRRTKEKRGSTSTETHAQDPKLEKVANGAA